MRNKKILFVSLAAVLLAVAAFLAFSPAFARYRAELIGDLTFQAKPPEKLSFAESQWTIEEDICSLTFSMEQDVERCRMFLAVSEGVTDPESLQVFLNAPGEVYFTVEGTCEQIPEVSDLEKVFGPGYVYYFYVTPEETDESAEAEEPEDPEEWIFSARADETFTLSVIGLESAAEATTLMRLFVERVD